MEVNRRWFSLNNQWWTRWPAATIIRDGASTIATARMIIAREIRSYWPMENKLIVATRSDSGSPYSVATGERDDTGGRGKLAIAGMLMSVMMMSEAGRPRNELTSRAERCIGPAAAVKANIN